MDHVVSPDDVLMPDVVDVEDTVDVEDQCFLDTCTEEKDYKCWGCHVNLCAGHATKCTHCDDPICEGCTHTYYGTAGTYCSHCVANMTDCCVCAASINKEADDVSYCESHDAWCCDTCYSGSNTCTDCDDGSSPESGTDASLGVSSAAPWEARGVHDPCTTYDEIDYVLSNSFTAAVKQWDIDNTLSLKQGAADFYLLEPVQHNLDCGQIAEPMLVVMSEEARLMRKELVANYDRAFTRYADMVIGGELRYHQAVGGGRHLPGERASAWRVWKALRARGGTELLVETARLFREISGGGVGGEAWAVATDLLHARLTGRISPEQYVDRVFTLQHNGGQFTNKIAWGPDEDEFGHEIDNLIGPAHSADPPDFATLLTFASREAGSLFRDWWPVANKNRLRWRIAPWLQTGAFDYQYLNNARAWFATFVNYGWTNGASQTRRFDLWDQNKIVHARRFKPFMITYTLANNHNMLIPWGSLDGRVARAVVTRTLHDQFVPVTYANMHVIASGYLKWLCHGIVEHNSYMAVELFDVLTKLGIKIPVQFHEAAGLGHSTMALPFEGAT